MIGSLVHIEGEKTLLAPTEVLPAASEPQVATERETDAERDRQVAQKDRLVAFLALNHFESACAALSIV